MEVVIAFILYILLIMLPLNGLILVAIRNERQANRRILMQTWRFRNRR